MIKDWPLIALMYLLCFLLGFAIGHATAHAEEPQSSLSKAPAIYFAPRPPPQTEGRYYGMNDGSTSQRTGARHPEEPTYHWFESDPDLIPGNYWSVYSNGQRFLRQSHECTEYGAGCGY